MQNVLRSSSSSIVRHANVNRHKLMNNNTGFRSIVTSMTIDLHSSINKHDLHSIQRRQFSSDRGDRYSNVEIVREEFVPTLMKMPLLSHPNTVAILWNWFYYKYRMLQLDPTFEFMSFLSGTKKAIVVVSSMIAQEDNEGLKNFLTPEAYEELSDNLKSFTDEQRQRVQVDEEDIKTQFIGLMKDYELDGKRFVEVSVVAHIFKTDPKESSSFRSLLSANKMTANYRFRREISANPNEEHDWKIVRFNHFYSIQAKFYVQNKP